MRLILPLLLALGCGRDVQLCLDNCARTGAEPRMCKDLCARSCEEVERTFGISRETCRMLHEWTPKPEPEPSRPPEVRADAAPDLGESCGDFVAFAWSCGIGRPPIDPTVDLGTQRNNELVVHQEVAGRCRRHERPYDERLIRCFLASGKDCERYRACAAR